RLDREGVQPPSRVPALLEARFRDILVRPLPVELAGAAALRPGGQGGEEGHPDRPEHGVPGSRTPPCAHGSRLDTRIRPRPEGRRALSVKTAWSRPAIRGAAVFHSLSRGTGGEGPGGGNRRLRTRVASGRADLRRPVSSGH